MEAGGHGRWGRAGVSCLKSFLAVEHPRQTQRSAGASCCCLVFLRGPWEENARAPVHFSAGEQCGCSPCVHVLASLLMPISFEKTGLLFRRLGANRGPKSGSLFPRVLVTSLTVTYQLGTSVSTPTFHCPKSLKAAGQCTGWPLC